MKLRKTLSKLGRMLQITAFALMGCLIGVPAAKAAQSPAPAPAEAGMVTGTIEDANGEPLIGATVLVKGTTTGTATDIDGYFSIKASAGQELIVTYVGYNPLTIKVRDGEFNLGKIIMEADINQEYVNK